jgi:carboxypeptidase PM20D1
MFRWILGLVVVAALGAGGVVAWRTSQFTPAPVPQAALAAAPDLNVDGAAAAARLGEAIRFETISVQPGEAWNAAPFTAQRAWLETAYPAFHQVATREIINNESLLFTWAGSDATLAPILILAHLDVVPVESWSKEDWTNGAFSGAVKDGYIWGRGAIDDKGSLIAILEAANALAVSGFKPKRTILFAFGHDEEVSGPMGAQAIAKLLKERGVKAWFAIDEGQAIIAKHPMTGSPVSLIGIAEKGYATLRITATARAGHSSTPDKDTAVTLLSEAILRVHRMPIEMRLGGGPALDMIRALAPQLPVTLRAAAANEWLFSPLINQRLGADPLAASMLRTTVAPTMVEGGPKDNILPGRAMARINFRLHPRDSAASILSRAQAAVKDIPGVTVEWDRPPNEASPVSSTSSDSFALIAGMARAVAPDALVAPSLVMAGTDSRYYTGVAQDVYRFAPAMFDTDDIGGIHGKNERLSVDNLSRMIKGYAHLMAAGAG